MKREGEKSRKALLVITVISKSFSERLDWSLLKSSPLTGNPQEDLSVKRNRRASGNEREEIGEGRTRVREKLDNSYVYTQNERILIAELGDSYSEPPRCKHCEDRKKLTFGRRSIANFHCVLNLLEWLIKCFWKKEEIDFWK